MARGTLRMIIKLQDGICIDGTAKSEKKDLYLVDGVIHSKIDPTRKIDETYDVSNHIVMPGGIDLHTHIGGGKVNLARMFLPDLSRSSSTLFEQTVAPLSSPVPPAWETGLRYIQMGYTSCFEPAVLPANARQSHLEMADIPWLDTGGYLLLGNDRMLLRWIATHVPQAQITEYVGWMLKAHQCCGVKVVNAGGIDAFKFNQRKLDVDETHVGISITPRSVLACLAQAVEELGLPHPIHVHCSNLGIAGNIESTMKTLEAVEGRRIHLTHAQYHCYGNTGPHAFSSEAYQLAEYVNWNKHVTIDIGQVLFGQTVTLSADTMHQFANRKLAQPRKAIFQDLECQAGCGVVPFRYREDQYVHGLQWTIGLELCLRILDPTKVFLTTDHPNGGPFTAYPHLIRLLMSYDYRMSIFERLHPDVRATSPLPSLKREYTLEEIALMTRKGPATVLGLNDRGTLESGKLADVVVYRKADKIDSM
ncbi:MAG: formylmethanofuran dehydrogenase subunit A, partial [Planctomycetes bacterium]|nr:formylmethanofuran dehydrogenase subunit A [Planctomycetota bacterium]